MSSYEAHVFLYFGQIRKKVASLKAQRLYNSFNLCPHVTVAMPAHVGKYCPLAQVHVLQNRKGPVVSIRFGTHSAQDNHWLAIN